YTDGEGRPYEGPSKDGRLDPNSYAATAVFGVVAKAVEVLGKASVRLTRGTINAFAGTLAHIILTAQEEMTGDRDWYAGANTRLRGALWSVLEISPAPFGQDGQAWRTWVEQSTKRCVAIAKSAVEVYSGDHTGEPWATLATDDEEAKLAA
ncbi:MAG TPA: PD-(D/E)XK nuclease family protein, partial [Beutenbergiaceae bacterium]|nr:PD-(D/E)XK nuclease family protein [Beutenbergiaceae bacterium]